MRKLILYNCGLLTVGTILSLTPMLTKNAVAQCIQADVSVQYNISGSRKPTIRSNDVQMQSDGNCNNNAIVTTSVQGNEGGNGVVIQRRTVRQQIKNNGNNNRPSDVIVPNIKVRSNVGIDVYNAADRLEN